MYMQPDSTKQREKRYREWAVSKGRDDKGTVVEVDKGEEKEDKE